MPTNHFSADCPSCGSRLKRLPATRRDSVHVYCMDCGHDFGRYEALVERYQKTLSELESDLEVPTASGRKPAELRAQE
ncbi:zf-TFIIB domain-containing protein [Halomonas sp. PAMB 3264]|uniref:TFIIB-type zinc ribbon-containing protein n=1 Tax=Halomonas sp. PAMB 3264 TaxID=3075222 RepID=UPI00289EF481|nr:zf-TFIIB domain-containing protein [Halomonas sp. PAMB 3264]WNL41709.1 zf-TFIIB domain-containing protein [Halomonas sp. PAMB 3264]